MEFNEGLKPNFDPDFDEAIQRNERGIALDNQHKEAVARVLSQFIIPTELSIGKPSSILTNLA